MKFKNLLSVIGSIAVMFGVVTTSTAATVTWTLADATFDDQGPGTNLSFGSGSFTLDTVTGEWSNIGFNTSHDTTTYFYNQLTPLPLADTTNLNFTYPLGSGEELQMSFDNPLPATGGIVNITMYENLNDGNLRICTDGCFLTGVPEVPVPAAVWLFGSGLIGLIGVARRKKN